MTIVDVFERADRILIATDSLLCGPDGRVLCDATGRPLLDTKVVPLRATGWMFATVGNRGLREALCNIAHTFEGIDDAIARLPDVLRGLHECLQLDSRRDGPLFRRQAVFAGGWSHVQGACVAASFASGQGYRCAYVAAQPPGQSRIWLDPAVPVCEYAGRWPSRSEDVLPLMAWQLDHHRARDPLAPAGGPAVAWELTRDGITSHVLGDLGLPPCA